MIEGGGHTANIACVQYKSRGKFGEVIQESTCNTFENEDVLMEREHKEDYLGIIPTKRKIEGTHGISQWRKPHSKTNGGIVMNFYERRNHAHTHGYVCL